MKNFKSLLSFIPNLITSVNLFFGCLSLVCAFNDNLLAASAFIFLAGLLDFCDGLTARLLDAYSEFGKMLDSLADMVSFGVAPSVILFQLINIALLHNYNFNGHNSGLLQLLISSLAFIIAIFSALRLAKFNLDKRQTAYFIGIPTPANAFLIASFPFVVGEYKIAGDILLKIYVLIPLIFILSFLLVSEIPMISLKFKNYTFHDNKARYILLFISLILLILFKIAAYPFIFLLYIILSLVNNPQKGVQEINE
jgi:CDP-diacylglycerol---serine O-phosphatidyltransferase